MLRHRLQNLPDDVVRALGRWSGAHPRVVRRKVSQYWTERRWNDGVNLLNTVLFDGGVAPPTPDRAMGIAAAETACD